MGYEMMRKEKRVTIIMDADIWEKFKQACREKDLTASQMVRRMVKDLINNEPGPIEVVPPREEE